MELLTKARQWTVALGLLTVVLVCVVGLYFTRDSGQTSGGNSKTTRHTPLVDEQPLQTARAMAALASDRDQLRFSQQALKLSDHEVDLAFADALRDASEHPLQATAQSKELYGRVSKAEAVMQADQDHIAQLKTQLAAARDTQKDSIQQEIDLTQAQLELDQDELDDAKEDLARSGIDDRSRIQRQFNRHEAAQQADASHPAAETTSDIDFEARNLLGQFRAWYALHGKVGQLEGAQNAALHLVDGLKQIHDALAEKVQQEETARQTITQQAAAQIHSGQPASAAGSTAAAAITSLHHLSDDQKDLADLDKRMQDGQELATLYGSDNWIGVVNSHQRTALHGLIQSAMWIVLIVLAVYLAGRLIETLFADLTPDHTRFRTLRVVLRFAVQAVGLLFILFVIFGTPKQLSTVLGLAGAGLTVALQDFIISFLGWFVLMGRNGIRVGDWVEINGVSGEVMEIGLLRTVLLETGNWTDAGHPTGRKVALMNSYAIQGHFFNFSTSGQWLWDELQIAVPTSDDLYPIIETIQKMVVKETEADSRAAEQEWKQATTRYRVQSVSAMPAVNLRPTTAGVEVHVRYITRANDRYATRTRLYEALVELLHHKGVDPATVLAASGKN